VATEFRAKAWNNGSPTASGSGYGLKITKADRDRFLKREWRIVILRFPDAGTEVEINIDNDSLWNDTCRELRSQKIGAWLIENRLAPWPHGKPPTVRLVQSSDRAFDVLPV